MTPKISAYTTRVFRAVDTAHRLDKIAHYYANDAEVLDKVAQAKRAVNDEVFDIVKQAEKSDLIRKLLQGAAVGTGATLPVAAGGAYLLGKARDDAEYTAGDVRDKVLQSGLGLAGIGAGMYGLQKLVGGSPLVSVGGSGNTEGPEGPEAFEMPQKQASAEDDARTELIRKLAAVDVLDKRLSNVDTTGMSPEATKLAEDVCALNRGYGVQLLYEASCA